MFRKIEYVVLLLTLGLLWTIPTFGQEEASHETKDEFHHHSIAVLLGHTYISQGIEDGSRDWLIVPSLALHYNYKFNENWILGWHNDLIIEEFIVKDSREKKEVLERSFPYSTLLVGTYIPAERWGLSLGGGAEFEKNKSFGLIRLGTEYGLHIQGLKLEVIFELNYDILIDAYDSMSFGVGIVKLF